MVNRARLQGYLALVVAFLLGAVVGGAALHAYGKRRLFDRMAQDGPRFAERHREQMLVRRLDLDEQQAGQLHQIFEKHGQRLRELGEAMLTQCGEPMRAQQQQMDDEIRALLHPDQLPRFEQMLERRAKHGFPPPPGPPPR